MCSSRLSMLCRRSRKAPRKSWARRLWHLPAHPAGLIGSASFRHHMNQLPNIEQQMQAVNDFFCQQADQGAHLKYISEEALAA